MHLIVKYFQSGQCVSLWPIGSWHIWGCKLIFVGYFFCSGPDNLENLRRLAEQFQKQAAGAGAGAAAAAAAAAAGEEDDDDVPELVPGETFEEAAEEKQASG